MAELLLFGRVDICVSKNRPSILAESKPISLFCSFDEEGDRIPDRNLSR